MDKEIAPIALKQRYNTLLQKLNSAVIDTNTGKRKDDLFVDRVVNLIKNGEKFRSRLSVEKIAIEEFGFSDKQFVKELTEYAIVVVARMIAKKYPLEEAYRNLVLLYENQPYSTHQTNVSISLNQYSTPVPISYLLGKYIGLTYDQMEGGYKVFEDIYFNHLKNWIDKTDKAHLEMIPINKTNWYPTKFFVKYAKEKDFDRDAEKPNFLEYIKNGGIIPPIIVEKSKCYQSEIKNDTIKLLEDKPMFDCYSVRDGVHRLSIYEELGIEMIPALVYSKRRNEMTRDFGGNVNSVQDLEKFVGVSLKDFFKNNFNKTKKIFLEPTAGNGMLTVAGNPKNIVVNEIDYDRLHILKKQGFKQILSQDATMPFPFEREFDGVLANPPFGGSSTLVIGGYNISGLDQQIIVKSLEYLKDNSKAAFIFGGHTAYDDKGRVKGAKDKAFLNYMARFYFIDDLINLNGRLYSKQGTSYPIRLLFIRSRKSNPEGFFPLKNNDLSNLRPFSPHVVMSFSELFDRTKNFF